MNKKQAQAAKKILAQGIKNIKDGYEGCLTAIPYSDVVSYNDYSDYTERAAAKLNYTNEAWRHLPAQARQNILQGAIDLINKDFPETKRVRVRYKFLKAGEILKGGDQFYDGEKWRATQCVGEAICAPSVKEYRRKVEPKATKPVEAPAVKPEPTPEPPKKPTPGYGYRLLDVGETIKEDDEVWYVITSTWTSVTSAGLQVNPPGQGFTGCTYRRKIDPRVGYKLLQLGDTIKEGDEYFSPTKNLWRETNCAGDKIQDFDNTYRRKVEPEPIKVDSETAINVYNYVSKKLNASGNVMTKVDELLFENEDLKAKLAQLKTLLG